MLSVFVLAEKQLSTRERTHRSLAFTRFILWGASGSRFLNLKIFFHKIFLGVKILRLANLTVNSKSCNGYKVRWAEFKLWIHRYGYNPLDRRFHISQTCFLGKKVEATAWYLVDQYNPYRVRTNILYELFLSEFFFENFYFRKLFSQFFLKTSSKISFRNVFRKFLSRNFFRVFFNYFPKFYFQKKIRKRNFGKKISPIYFEKKIRKKIPKIKLPEKNFEKKNYQNKF